MRNEQVILIRLNKHTYAMWNKYFNGTKLIILTFTHKTHFHELRNTLYLCRLQPNYDTECIKVTGINILRSNRQDFNRNKNVFLHSNSLKYDTKAFYKRNVWFRFVWTSPTFTMSKKISSTAKKLWYSHLLVKRIFVRWEMLYIFVSYNQSMIRNAKSLQV
jgi:hypothetical protein